MRSALNPARWIPTEFAVAVHPEPQRTIDAGWRRRIRAFPGRSLSHLALQMEQDERGGRLALRGQMLSAGVVQGLYVDAETIDGASVLRLSPGIGIAASGEDVTLRTEIVVAAGDLVVWGTRDPEDPSSADVTLAELRAGGPAPRALVLVLQPAEIRARDGGDPEDPCENDPAADAFADHQRIDAALPLLVRLPESLDQIAELGPAETRRNRIAHAIFEEEAALAPPWSEVGAPLALLGFDDAGQIAFVDRHAVARKGGRACGRTAILAAPGSPALWQARIEQLSEHLVDALAAVVEDIRGGFVFAPPAGVLPLVLVDDLPDPGRKQLLFPPHFTVEWAPIPVEQLDAAVAASAPLARFDFRRLSIVRILVPVPLAQFEPRLLVEETVSDEFQKAIDELTVKLLVARRVRDKTRDHQNVLMAALDGPDAVPLHPPDPMKFPEEKEGPLPPDVEPDVPIDIDVSDEIEALKTAVEQALLGKAEKKALTRLESDGVRGLLDHLKKVLAATNDAVDFRFLRVQADIYRARQIFLSTDKASRLATSPALAGLVKGSTAYATVRDLEALFVKRASTQPAPAVVAAAPNVSFSAPAAAFAPSGITSSTSFALDDEITTPLPYTKPGTERSVSIAERLEASSSIEAQRSAVSTKYEGFAALKGLEDEGLRLEGIVVTVPDDKGVPRQMTLDEKGFTIEDAIKAAAREPSDDRDESAALNAGVRMLDETISVMRQIEVRALVYRRLIKLALTLLAKLEKTLADIETRLKAADKALTEARHDFGVAKALLAEEMKRIAELNARRAAILREHVRFVAFVRPRTQLATDDLPSRDLESPEEAPLPACLHEDIVGVPVEIRQAVDLVRRAPLGWLHPWQHLVDALGDRGTLIYLVKQAAKPAAAAAPFFVASPAAIPTAALPLAQGLLASLASMTLQLEERDQKALSLDIAQVEHMAWKDLRLEALNVVSLADLSSIGHLRPDVLGGVTAALDRMTRVATCIYRRFAEIRPELRLAWAQQVSVHDAAVSLRNLSILHRFHEVDGDDREALQILVDWLFAQISGAPQPRAMMSNLVRVCLLLASHAPVRQLLRGKVPPVTITVGHVLRVAELDVAQVRVGMHVLLDAAGDHLGRAVVEDIAEGHAVARVVFTKEPTVTLPESTAALVADAEHLPGVAAQVFLAHGQ